MKVWPLTVSADPHLACAGMPFRHAGRLFLMVAAKATFTLVDGADCRVSPPQPFVDKDRYAGGNGASSLEAASDVLPYRPRCDVTLAGHAMAPEGQRVTARAVRLAI